jgi:Protein kinase domain
LALLLHTTRVLPALTLAPALNGFSCDCCTVVQLDNILLHGDAPAILKLCDFGYSKDGETESDCKTACGTPEYMAPEVHSLMHMCWNCMLSVLLQICLGA